MIRPPRTCIRRLGIITGRPSRNTGSNWIRTLKYFGPVINLLDVKELIVFELLQTIARLWRVITLMGSGARRGDGKFGSRGLIYRATVIKFFFFFSLFFYSSCNAFFESSMLFGAKLSARWSSENRRVRSTRERKNEGNFQQITINIWSSIDPNVTCTEVVDSYILIKQMVQIFVHYLKMQKLLLSYFPRTMPIFYLRNRSVSPLSSN